MAKEFKGEAGTIYLETSPDGDETPWRVWFEDFCIIGQGRTRIEALQDAASHLAGIGLLVAQAMNQEELTLTEEEAQLVIGAIPLQSLPEGDTARDGSGE